MELAVLLKESIVELGEKFDLRFVQIRLQDDNLTAEITITSNMDKERFRVGDCPFRISAWANSLGVRKACSRLNTHSG